MKIEQKISLKNYKCFDNDGATLNSIFPINIIIGKNNSGKSSLLDLVEFLTGGNKSILENSRNNHKTSIQFEHILSNYEIERIFTSNTSGGGIPGNHYHYGQQFIGNKYVFEIFNDNSRKFLSIDREYDSGAETHFESIKSVIKLPFLGYKYCSISAERDIRPETSNDSIKLESNGQGATNLIQLIINKTERNSNLIEETLLKEFNKIVNPEINFRRILVQQNDDSKWELFFIDENKNRIALSKMGSGIKTILIVLLNLIVRPIIENKKKNSYIYAFEELENNLHPSLQRRLYEYIKKYSQEYKAYFFLTTHSNIVIDTFGTYENSQITHIINESERSITNTTLSYLDTKNIIEDLGLKASDLLQTNGIIWVEGPSDRNFILKWLDLINPNLKEGVHFSIMFYGGRLLSNLTFDYNWFQKEIIPIIKINRNAFIMMDRDGKNISTKLNDTKKRIQKEIGEQNCWITRGREVENYLSNNTIKKWLKTYYNISKFNINNPLDIKIEDSITNSHKTVKLKYNSSKTLYSKEICEHIVSSDLDILDLRKNLINLENIIKKWN